MCQEHFPSITALGYVQWYLVSCLEAVTVDFLIMWRGEREEREAVHR
jgi:hypothetical protein